MGNGELGILLIDDDELTNQIHESIIGVWAKDNITVKTTTFAEAEMALAWLQTAGAKELPELILLDINMPVMNGWQFLEAFQSLPFQIPICVLSSSVQKIDEQRALATASVIAYISKPLKPVNMDQLLSSLP